jgi:hypothetical protein
MSIRCLSISFPATGRLVVHLQSHLSDKVSSGHLVSNLIVQRSRLYFHFGFFGMLSMRDSLTKLCTVESKSVRKSVSAGLRSVRPAMLFLGTSKICSE